ncbi:hypothetical protein GE061_010929 [Apolygus lucorum]|uniref:Peptidase S1 domain-containing protein n=1 Tax=Apolygus lucorum TaxID=248454 RepID=A0A8S9XVX7_APOLU|nr:hypothetical protein GE061_010929 [Apolygus lucorum]
MVIKAKFKLSHVISFCLTLSIVQRCTSEEAESYGNENSADSGEGQDIPFCGASVVQNLEGGRIVGGLDAKPYEFPWMAKLFYHRNLRCAATLVADRYMVTAAHCIAEYKKGSSLRPRRKRKSKDRKRNYVVLSAAGFVVGLGSHNTWGLSTYKRKVDKIITHPNFDYFASGNREVGSYMIQTNDIAILKFRPVDFSTRVVPVCLPPQGVRVKNNMELVLAGWGSINSDDLSGDNKPQLPHVLQKTKLMKISFKECQKNENVGMHFNKQNQLTEREVFCLMGNETDSCQGDSGGPVVEKTYHGYRLVGLVSWGIGCNMEAYPSAYTQVSSYMEFLIRHTRDGKFLPFKH